MPMMITAAGTLAPAKGLVIGAGVAGLQAIATARRMGAVMFGYDVRPAVGEQVRSLGANFVDPQVVVAEAEHASGYAKRLSVQTQQRERDIVHEHVAEVDFVITTAAVPGQPAPKIVTEAMVKDMRPGAVIVDIAAESGGNCDLTKPGEVVLAHGVAIHGPLGLPSSMPVHASQMYSRNISNFLLHLVDNGAFEPDFDDEITMASCVTHDGQIIGVPVEGQGRTEPRGSAVKSEAGEDTSS
jgi:NAD(P) transhydrogenase subunit alpha